MELSQVDQEIVSRLGAAQAILDVGCGGILDFGKLGYSTEEIQRLTWVR